MEAGPSTAPDPRPPIGVLLRRPAVDQQTISELLIRVRDLLVSTHCTGAAEVLTEEIQKLGYVPGRYDLNGECHPQSLDKFLSRIGDRGINLVDVLGRLNDLAEPAVPPVLKGLPIRLFARGRQAITRVADKPGAGRRLSTIAASRPSVNSFQGAPSASVLASRELGVRVPNRFLLPKESMQTFTRHSRVLGHLSPAFCVTFDRTGRYIITGSDDYLIKVWDAYSGLLRFTFRGHTAEVVDAAVSHDNTLIGSGSVDGYVRIWSLKDGRSVLVGKPHTQAVAFVHFLPFVADDHRYFVTCGNDANIVFQQYNAKTLDFKPPIKFNERTAAGVKATSLCHSPGGNVVVMGSSNQYLYFYTDIIDSLAWAHGAMRFASGSKDGVAKVWILEAKGSWKRVELRLPPTGIESDASRDGKPKGNNAVAAQARNNAYRLMMLGWSLQDDIVITTGSDYVVRTWNWRTGENLKQMRAHTDCSYNIVSHPIHKELVITTGHDGLLVVWDIYKGESVSRHVNQKDMDDAVSIFDAKVSPDGTKMACVDGEGCLSILGIEEKRVSDIPNQQFLKRDYYPLITDPTGYALDEQTGITPDLLYPQLMVNAEAEECAESIQRLMPGNDLLPIKLTNGEIRHPEPTNPWITRPIVAPLSSSVFERTNRDMELTTTSELEEFLSAKEGRIILDIENAAGAYQLEARQNRPRAPRRRTDGPSRNAALNAHFNYLLNHPPGVPRYVLDADVVSDPDDEDYSGDESGHSEARAESSQSSPSQNNDFVDIYDGDYEEGDDADDLQRVWTSRNRRERRTRLQRESTNSSSVGSEQSHESAEAPTATRHRRVQARQSNQQSSRGRAVIEDSEEDAPSEHSPEASDTARIRRPKECQDHEDESVGPSRSSKSKKQTKKVKKEKGTNAKHTLAKLPKYLQRFPEWLQETRPRRFPYMAQVGDVVVYFTQGHKAYLDKVKKKKVYKVENKLYPRPDLDAEETCLVVEIDYVLTPYRLCQMTLAQLKKGRKTGKVLDVLFHDYEDQPDFFVLKQHYDISQSYKFAAGAKVESIVDDKFYTGTVQKLKPYREDFPRSNWASVVVMWDNGEDDCVSPWELQPKTSGRISELAANEEDLRRLAEYKPEARDWPHQNEGQSIVEARKCYLSRTKTAIAELLTVEAIRDVFGQPVDVHDFHDYPKEVAYPIDLGIIVQRIDNGFYRRSLALLQDIQFIAINATRYNEIDTDECRSAVALVEALFTYLSDWSCASVKTIYEEVLLHVGSDERELEWGKAITADNSLDQEAVEVTSDSPKWVVDCRAAIDEIMPDETTLEHEEVKRICENHGYTIPQMLENLPTFKGPQQFMDDLKLLVADLKANMDKRSHVWKQLNEFDRKLDTKMKPIVGIYNRMSQSQHEKNSQRAKGSRRAKNSHFETNIQMEDRALDAAIAESLAMQNNVYAQRQLRERRRPEPMKAYNTRDHSNTRSAATDCYDPDDDDPDVPCSSSSILRPRPMRRQRSSIALAVASPGAINGFSQAADISESTDERVASALEADVKEEPSQGDDAEVHSEVSEPQLNGTVASQIVPKVEEEEDETSDNSDDSDYHVDEKHSPAETEQGSPESAESDLPVRNGRTKHETPSSSEAASPPEPRRRASTASRKRQVRSSSSEDSDHSSDESYGGRSPAPKRSKRAMRKKAAVSTGPRMTSSGRVVKPRKYD